MEQVLLYAEMMAALEIIYKKMEEGKLFVMDGNNQPDMPATLLLISKISGIVIRTKFHEQKNE
jgi:hypothetical protein